MGHGGTGRDPVGERLGLLQDRYGAFPVSQTTIAVPADGYERARERTESGVVDVYVRVWNDDGEALHVRCESAFDVRESPGEHLAARVQAAVRRRVDVRCSVEGIDRVTIAGIRNEEDPDAPTQFRLFVLFDARHAGGTPEDVDWETPTVATPEFG